MSFHHALYHGKWYRASDTISCNPVTMVQSLLDTFPIKPSPIDTDESDEICAAMRLTAFTSISQLDGYPAITSLDCICFAGQKDTQYTLLGKTRDNGFPNSRQATLPTIQEYWEVRNHLSNDNGLILLDWRIVIPTFQCKNILKSLHSAHQGVVGMKMCANESVYWPGMNASICNYRDNCITCSRNAPSLPHEPIQMKPTLEWFFNKLCGFVLCWILHVSHLCRQAHWMTHSVQHQTRLSSCLQIDIHLQRNIPSIRCA